MTWTAPMTAVASTVLTAAQWNIHGRNNLNALAPAVAVTAGSWIVTAGFNTLAERIPSVGFKSGYLSTDSTSYVDLDGPVVSVTSGPRALVSFGAQVQSDTAGRGGRVAVEVTGATDMGASDLNSYYTESANAGDDHKGSWVTIFDENYNAGDNILTLKYRAVGAGTATFNDRCLAVIPF